MQPTFGYAGKRVLVVGGASGMGASAARLANAEGAALVVLDVAEVPYPCEMAIRIDLRDQSSVDAALERIEGPLDAVFSCAGVADGTRGLMQINFTSQRHLIDALVDSGRLGRGSSIVMVSSTAGAGWLRDLDRTAALVGTEDWAAADEFIGENPEASDYRFSKQAVNYFVASRAFSLLQKGVRINAVCPGPTNTPLAAANADIWLAYGSDYREAAGIETMAAEEAARVILFLGSDAASGISGSTIVADQGMGASTTTGTFVPAPPKG